MDGDQNECNAQWVDGMFVHKNSAAPLGTRASDRAFDKILFSAKAFALVALAVIALAGCDRSPDSTDVPSQHYTSRINLIGKPAGSLRGQVVFPSAYSQRSAAFYVNGVQLATQPDGRFWVRSIPAGDHLLRVYVPGFEPVVRTIRIGGAQVTDAQVLALHPAWGRVLGRVVTDDGRSAAGAMVRLEPYGLIGAADKDGIFQFMGVGAGEHLLAVQCAGCDPAEQALKMQPNETRNLGILTIHRRADTAADPALPSREVTGG
jgi:hypothetical protein